MKGQWLLSPTRQLTEAEQSLIWKKPSTHIESQAERRICAEVKRNWNNDEMKITNILLEGDAGSGKTQLAKALSAEFSLPYTKITCFADMDKSDVLGSILPVLPEDRHKANEVNYQFYPSEIVRAYENGWLLEIQEPTVIRDAAVLMALNSALEPEGSINLPTRIAHRHPDFIAVITTNRGYNGCRPLNEALRDRIHHAEKLDLPPKAVMVERALARTRVEDASTVSVLADIIITLDETARANAIKGVAGMRSYLFWVDAVAHGQRLRESMYYKVIYKITTEPSEIALLEEALTKKGHMNQLERLENLKGLERLKDHMDQADMSGLEQGITDREESQNPEVMELYLSENGRSFDGDENQKSNAVRLRKSSDSEGHSDQSSTTTIKTQSRDKGEDGIPIYHELEPSDSMKHEKQEFRKKLNQEARESVKGTCHQLVKLIVHRPEVTEENRLDYHRQAVELGPVIEELIRKTEPLLEHESSEFAKAQFYGARFCAHKVAGQDFRTFEKRRPPQENPTLAVALRLDESASMTAFGRLEAAKQSAVALFEFCKGCHIPIMIWGDTADRSRLEQMSIYSYVDFQSKDPDEKYSLMNIQGRSNNRDGMALRIIADRLLQAPQQTKLFISISDGQPKAIPDYTGDVAIADMKKTLQEYRRKGILFFAAAIGQDKEIISEIYGKENTLDITDLKRLPTQLVQIIAKHL